jgi:hypothetical protein
LTQRHKRHALRRSSRFERLERCDLPSRSESSFFSWLRDVSEAMGAKQPAPLAGNETSDGATTAAH